MFAINMTLTFILDERTVKGNNLHPLKLRIIHNRSSAHLSMGFDLLNKEWNSKTQALRNSSTHIKNVTRFNNILSARKSEYMDVAMRLEEEGKLQFLTAAQLKNHFTDAPKKIVSLYDFIKMEHDWLVEAGKQGTARTYHNLATTLRNFSNKDLNFTDIDYNFLKGLERNHLANGSNYGSLSVYLRTLRAVFNKAINKGYVNKKFYPFDNYKIKDGEPAKRALTAEEFEKLLQTSYKEGSALQIGRDYFLISYFLQGMNWMDMCHLKYENFSSDLTRLNYIRRKTGKPFNIKVPQNAINLINKYKKIDADNLDDYVLPVLSKNMSEIQKDKKVRNRRLKINSYLRQISRTNGIPSFSIYSARHTFANMLWDSSKSISVTQKSLGHQTEKQTQDYLSYFKNQLVDDATDEMFKGIVIVD